MDWHELYENAIFIVLFIVISGIISVIRERSRKDMDSSHYFLTILALSFIWFIYYMFNK